MIERNGIKLYTAKEIEKVMCIGYQRISDAMKDRTLIATDIEPWRGRSGFRYLFSEEEINRYSEKVGLPIRWERLEMENTYDEEHEQKVLEAKREVREEYDPTFSDDAIQITAENVHEIFGNRQEAKKEPEEKYEFYILKLGKGYVTVSQGLTPTFHTDCMMLKDCAEKMQDMYGGTVLQICAEAVG